MSTNKLHYFIDYISRKSQTFQYILGYISSYNLMVVEANAIIRALECHRFADIVKQRTPNQTQ